MRETLEEVGEFGLIERIDATLKREGTAPAVTLGIGDDAASFRPRAGFEVLITCDCLVEGRHYLPEHIKPKDLGRRAMAVNISDIGAMGGVPTHALVSLGLKSSTRVVDVLDLYRGFVAELNPLDADIIGGNITKTEHANFIDITLLGEAEKATLVRRSTAHPGDVILVTGYPGQSAAGLGLLLHPDPGAAESAATLVHIYNVPIHRAREGRAVALAGCATAMIDTSDGFLGDLGHLCADSGVGAELFGAQLPLSRDLVVAARVLGKDPLDLLLGDSDDYELLITCAPDRVKDVRRAIRGVGPLPVTEVGRITEDHGTVHLISPDGVRRRLNPSGWDHFSR